MNTTTAIVGVDLAKNRFEVAVANLEYRITERKSLSRKQFEQFIIAQRSPAIFVLEACGTAHYWGRRLRAHDHQVRLLPAQYVRAYVKRNKTDRADAAALIEASRCEDIKPVPVKTADQQQVQQLHRLREQYKGTRNQRINQLRGMLREFGIPIPKGLLRGLSAIRDALEIADNGLPDALRPYVEEGLEEIKACGQRINRIERELKVLTRESERVRRWLEVPGIGLLGATATYTAVVDVNRFPSGRHFASWLGITPKEYSSGERRRLGRISKRGDKYLRTLIVHGARSALNAARSAEKAGKPLDPLRRWALQTERRCGTNKATVALANKIARILWATAKYDRPFNAHWSTTAQAPSSQAA